MRSETVTTVLPVSQERVFEYMSDIRNLPEWATEFARELREENGEFHVVNNLGEFVFEIRADQQTGVIDMYAGPSREQLAVFPPGQSSCPMAGPATRSRCSSRLGCRTSCSSRSTPP
jgi:hypothetical protein